MPNMLTVQLSEEELVNALRQLSPIRRRQLLQQLEDESRPVVVSIPAAQLDQLTGLIAIGGDALTESEQLYDD
jgi:hypothetical protein